MTRLELLTLVIIRARSQGFEFRRWYVHHMGLPWISSAAAVSLLDSQRRYYALIFSHDFAKTFWKPGSDIVFDVPSQTFQRAMPDGSIRMIHRKPFIRRTARPNAWRYHLRQMALADEPLRYLRKYLHLEQDSSQADVLGAEPSLKPSGSEAPQESRKLASPKPLPTEPPPFLQRPYRPASK